MNNYYIIDGCLYSSDELYHYGVKGMKWGHRKRLVDMYNQVRSSKVGQMTSDQYNKAKARSRAATEKTIAKYDGNKKQAMKAAAKKFGSGVAINEGGYLVAKMLADASNATGSKSIGAAAISVHLGTSVVGKLMAINGAVEVAKLARYK